MVERHVGSVHIRYVREVVEVFLCFFFSFFFFVNDVLHFLTQINFNLFIIST